MTAAVLSSGREIDMEDTQNKDNARQEAPDVQKKAGRRAFAGLKEKYKTFFLGFFMLWGVIIAILITVALAVVTQWDKTSELALKKELRNRADQIISEKVFIPKYVILDKDVFKDNESDREKVIMRVLIAEDVSEMGLRTLLNQVYYSEKARRGFRHFDYPRDIEILAFTSIEHAESEMGQWIARLTNINESGKPEIGLNDRQIANLRATPERKWGLSQDKRKRIWREMIISDDRASREAEIKYPLPGRNGAEDELKESEVESRLVSRYAYEKMLINSFRKGIAGKYDLTLKQLDEISVEGTSKDWPYPR